MGSEGDRRDLFPLPRLPTPPPPPSRSKRAIARARRRRRVQALANAAIDALNSLFAAPRSASARASRAAGASPAAGPRIRSAIKYILACVIPYADPPDSGAGCENSADTEEYHTTAPGGPVSLDSALLSLPERGGGFPAADYAAPDLAAFARGEAEALEDPFIAELAASEARSCQRASPSEYVSTVARLEAARMLEFSSEPCPHPLGLFAVWKTVGSVQRVRTWG